MDNFGDRMKMYEGVEAQRRFLPLLPIVVRIDGKGFSKWTKGLNRPYDDRLSELMVNTTIELVERSNAVIGYTQSDEISLILYSDSAKSQVYFDGRVQKLTSVLASIATAYFNARVPFTIPEKVDNLALFDCRCWNVPTLEEAANSLLWREQDATKNSVSMAAREFYSHKRLHGKTGSEMQEMLFEKGVNWNNYPDFFKRGTYVQRKVFNRTLTPEELADLPEKHHARLNPDMVVKRSSVVRLSLPPFTKVKNRVGVVFNAEDPVLL